MCRNNHMHDHIVSVVVPLRLINKTVFLNENIFTLTFGRMATDMLLYIDNIPAFFFLSSGTHYLSGKKEQEKIKSHVPFTKIWDLF